MVESITYGMGQIRYSQSSPSKYLEEIECTPQTKKVAISSDETSIHSGPWYQDIYLKLSNNFSFDADDSYALHLEIPKNKSYDTTFLIRMIKSEEAQEVLTEGIPYQKIKYIDVPKETNRGSFSRVILYPVDKEEQKPLMEIPSSRLNEEGNSQYLVKVGIAENWDGTSPLSVGSIGYMSSNAGTGLYYLQYSETERLQIFNKTVSLINHTWEDDIDIDPEIVKFDLVFSPHSSQIAYDGIWIQMIRTNYDIDIYNSGIYGRTINEKFFKCSLYKVINLIDGKTDGVPSPLSHIGVYGHPGLLMAIEGQEIKIGQTGYYELNDFNITSLGVFAKDANDKFTIDYQFKRSED